MAANGGGAAAAKALLQVARYSAGLGVGASALQASMYNGERERCVLCAERAGLRCSFVLQWTAASARSSSTACKGCWTAPPPKAPISWCRSSSSPLCTTSAPAPAPSAPSPARRVRAPSVFLAPLLSSRSPLSPPSPKADLQQVNLTLRVLSRPDNDKLPTIYKAHTFHAPSLAAFSFSLPSLLFLASCSASEWTTMSVCSRPSATRS